MRKRQAGGRRHFWLLTCVAGSWLVAGSLSAQVGPEPLTVDHYVLRETALPAADGQHVALYLRERAQAGTLARGRDLEGRVVLFVHGAGTPAEVAFDVPFADYSWMAHLARAGFDVFAMDVTGYGRSTRPSAMNDQCNLSAEAAGELLGAACAPSYEFELSNIQSEWDDIDAVVDYITDLRAVDRVSLVGWSLGGPRAGGYAARNPDRIDRVVLLAPAYSRDSPPGPPDELPRPGPAFTKQSADDFIANWDRQVGCHDQYDPAAAAAIWLDMLESDPVGATWGTGVRRAPRTTVWGFGPDAADRINSPVLIIQGAHDAQVTPDRARTFYEDLATQDKVYLDLGCASHNAMWERVHGLMFDASVEWLTRGTVEGRARGSVRLGHE